MSEELSGTDTDPTGADAELSLALRRFAAGNETYSPLTGAQVRGRAARRARRRVTGILVAATAAVALVAYASTLDLTDSSNRRHSTQPAAPGYENGIPAATTMAATPAPISHPLGRSINSPPCQPRCRHPEPRQTRHVGREADHLAAERLHQHPKFTGPLTVYDRRPDLKLVTVADPADGSRYNAEISYAVELRDADNTPVYVGAALRYGKENVGGSGAAAVGST